MIDLKEGIVLPKGFGRTGALEEMLRKVGFKVMVALFVTDESVRYN